MTTLSDIESRIFDETKLTFSTAIRNAVMASYRFYRHKRFWFNESVATFSASTSLAQYTLSTVLGARELIMLDSLSLLEGTTRRNPTPVPWKRYVKRTDRTSIGAVSEYTAHHGVLYFYPTPNSGAAVEVSGVFNFTLTSSGSSSGVWTNEAGELILARTSSIFMLNYMHDPQGALAMKAYEREVLLALQEETAQRLLDFNDNEPYILDYSRRRGDKPPKPYEGVAESIYQQSGSGRGGGQGQG